MFETQYIIIWICLCTIMAIFWLSQILSLMGMRDDEFPGRFDKPIWAAIIIALPVLGAAAFLIWNGSLALVAFTPEKRVKLWRSLRGDDLPSNRGGGEAPFRAGD